MCHHALINAIYLSWTRTRGPSHLFVIIVRPSALGSAVRRAGPSVRLLSTGCCMSTERTFPPPRSPVSLCLSALTVPDIFSPVFSDRSHRWTWEDTDRLARLKKCQTRSSGSRHSNCRVGAGPLLSPPDETNDVREIKKNTHRKNM